MSAIKHIFVALDMKDDEGSPSARQAWDAALQIAHKDNSRLTLIHVMEVSEKVKKQILDGKESPSQAHYKKTKAVIARMTSAAESQGVKAEGRVLFGKAWLTLIKEVLKDEPDLLLAGAASRGPVAEALFGSTTIKLLRQCPCPVWVTKLREANKINSILVAHDLTEIGTSALEWGASVAQNTQAQLHVLHSLELEGYDSFLASLPADEVQTARSKARERIEQELNAYELSSPAKVVITQGSPHASIYEYLEEQSIELLVMGTIARTGLAGVFTGNTAESLLPWVRCSIIALKPKEFVSPVSKD